MELHFHFFLIYLNKRKPAELTSAHPSSSTVQSKPKNKEGILNRQRRAYKGHYEGKKKGNSIEGTGGHKEGKTRNCNLP